MRSIMAPQIVDVLIKQCEAGIERHKMNVRVLTEKRVGLAEHGDLIITPPFFCRPYVPLHLIIQRPDQRREIFIKAIQVHINMKFLVPLPTCVYFVLKNSLSSTFDDELARFICNFPKKSHLKKISSCTQL